MKENQVLAGKVVPPQCVLGLLQTRLRTRFLVGLSFTHSFDVVHFHISHEEAGGIRMWKCAWSRTALQTVVKTMKEAPLHSGRVFEITCSSCGVKDDSMLLCAWTQHV